MANQIKTKKKWHLKNYDCSIKQNKMTLNRLIFSESGKVGSRFFESMAQFKADKQLLLQLARKYWSNCLMLKIFQAP